MPACTGVTPHAVDHNSQARCQIPKMVIVGHEYPVTFGSEQQVLVVTCAIEPEFLCGGNDVPTARQPPHRVQ